LLEFFTFFNYGSRYNELFSFYSLLRLRSGFLAPLKLISICEFRTLRSRLYCTTCLFLYFSSLSPSDFSFSSLFYRKLIFYGYAVTNRCFRYFFKPIGDIGYNDSPYSDNEPNELLVLPILRIILL
jgi:hypothetical protein